MLLFCYILCFKVGKCQDTVSGTISLVLFLFVLSYHIITQLFFTTLLGKKLKNKIAQQFCSVKTEEQINLVIQDNNKVEPVTYSEVDPPTRGEELLPSHSDTPRSRRNVTNNVSESADYEENELKPIEQKVTDSSTPYILMKQH